MKLKITLLLAVLFSTRAAWAQEPFRIETDSFVLGIGPDAAVTEFSDRQSGVNYCKAAAGTRFASVRSGNQTFPADTARYASGLLTLGFKGLDGEAVLRVVPAHRRLGFEVASFTCKDADEFLFAAVPMTLEGKFTEPFAVSPLALALNTNCSQIPGLSPGLEGFTVCKRFGFTGAQGAIVGCATHELREALKEALQSSPGLAPAPLGGPWALDAPINQGSYLIAMDEYVTPENAGKWIAAARAAGATQIDFHGGKAFRWGDFEVNKSIYPQGRESLKAAVDAVHAAGMAAGLHTYAFFIDKESPWVTPVPDPRLATDAAFTLDGDIAADADTLVVEESTAGVSAVTGFQVRNSATLRLDDELITYTFVDQQPPFAFRGCVRGACGTKAAPHAKGTQAKHFKECFGLFVPQGDSTLFTEVARHTADLYNACGFDMLYLDALDGSDILEGPRYAWHYEALFVDELLRRVEKPPVMEMSTFSHHLWRARSRMQAWDCAQRWVKAFVDCHVADNRQWKAAFLPTHLGWWGNFDWSGIQPERTYPDDLEYVCAKALATDSSLSYLVGFSPEKLALGGTQRLAVIAQRYERLRSAGSVPQTIKDRLATPGQDFSLEMKEDGTPQFRPAAYLEHSVTAGTGDFTVDNPYAAQPLRLRIEALMVPAPYDAPDSAVLADTADPGAFGAVETQQGVTAAFTRENPEAVATLSAQNTNVERYRAWASARKDFTEPANLQNSGLGLWVVGDGQGEVLNVQVRSPYPLGGGFADHYIPVDFTGRRYFELVEPESEAMGRYEWAHTRRLNDMLSNPRGAIAVLYPMCHLWVDYGKIATLTVGVNNVPAGRSVQVGVGAIKALPLRKGKLVNPAVKLGGGLLTFPVTLDSGSYLEFLGSGRCKVYDEKGNDLGDVVPTGPIPELVSGHNALGFDCDARDGGTTRARLTVIAYGEPLRP
jgi:hypothetical protein